MKNILFLLLFLFSFSNAYSPLGEDDTSVISSFKDTNYTFQRLKEEHPFIYENVPFYLEKKEKNSSPECSTDNLNGFSYKKCINFRNLKTQYSYWMHNYDDFRYDKKRTKIKNDRFVPDNVSLEFVFDNINDFKKIESHFFEKKLFSSNKNILINSNFTYDNFTSKYNIVSFSKRYLRNSLYLEEKDSETIFPDFYNFGHSLELSLLENKDNVEIESNYINYFGKHPVKEVFYQDDYNNILTQTFSIVYDTLYKLNINKKKNKIYLKITISQNYQLHNSVDRYYYLIDHESDVINKYLERKDFEESFLKGVKK